MPDVQDAATAAADEAAGFAAGYAQATGQPTAEPKIEPASKAEPAKVEPAQAEPAKPAVKQPAKQAQPQATAQPSLDALTREVAALKTGIKDQIHGVLGNWLEKNKLATGAAPATATPAAAKLTVEKLKRMSENFPDIAEALMEDLKEISIAAQGMPAAEVTKLLDERTAQANTEIQTRIDTAIDKRIPKKDAQKAEAYLTRTDPKWLEDINTKEFGAWLATLDEYESADIRESDDPRVVKTALADFRKWRDDQQKAAAQPTSKQRLEAALTPQGQPGKGSSEPSEEEAFAAGYNSVRRAA